jgi:hypothetical protein
MAKGAAESGAVESYMCNKVKRNPVVASRCAAYLGEFEAEEGANGIQKDTQWLVRSYIVALLVTVGGYIQWRLLGSALWCVLASRQDLHCVACAERQITCHIRSASAAAAAAASRCGSLSRTARWAMR